MVTRAANPALSLWGGMVSKPCRILDFNYVPSQSYAQTQISGPAVGTVRIGS